MVEAIQLLQGVGQFDSIAPGAQLPFGRMSMIYAENGRGKTTMAAVLRSLSNGDARLITDRHRVGAANPPHIVVDAFGGGQHTFQNGAWSAPLATLAVFDDAFVSENVCSGIEIESGHRQNLHELILGAQGVVLNTVLQGHVAAIEEHNRQLRLKENAIPAAARAGLSVDDFCALVAVDNVDARIQESERALAAAKASAEVQAEPNFAELILPTFDVAALNALLGRDMPELDAAAAAQVQAHLANLGQAGERWVSDGVHILSQDDQPWPEKDCPFCAQSLHGSGIINHYRAYFSAEYAALKSDLTVANRNIGTTHSGEAPAAFERNVATALQRRTFWLPFLEVPEVAVDTAEIARNWKAARNAVQAAIAAKQAAPLEPAALNDDAVAAIDLYHRNCQELSGISAQLLALNERIAVVKEQAQAANVPALTDDLNRLKATESRYSANIAPFCDDYLAEKQAKQATETARANARTALDNYRQNIFPAYEAAINNYLGRFNAGFRLGGVGPVNNRGGSSATYNVVINNVDVPLTANAGPSFRTALSAGDRNTLALAFFFASLEQDQGIAGKIVVIDDPMTSLDEHRSLVTIQEIRGLLDRVSQIIVLSHSKPFLISLWKAAPYDARAAMRIGRAAVGSTLEEWNVNQDSITEHDRRFARTATYLLQPDPARERVVAGDLRPMLEAYVRVAYAGIFPPGSMLGRFIDLCRQKLGGAEQILNLADTTELRALLDYANRFHHDTNPTYQTENINEAELTNFAHRTLAFMRRA
ncbi:AAA family ATPase [Sphingomonas sp. CBMAI 2297]|uniref:AAA family ATPase n=1 Tax=Sphingomonas sp. CBMAI 2297 TaxID=2991720 RepID=UPI002458387F|nr:AAA family ATPase [Sphingomonas sp. CBMAI 2297]MDH4745870.1 AAA family ATPase [Sphingomonas sp. CBMAI 2297]